MSWLLLLMMVLTTNAILLLVMFWNGRHGQRGSRGRRGREGQNGPTGAGGETGPGAGLTGADGPAGVAGFVGTTGMGNTASAAYVDFSVNGSELSLSDATSFQLSAVMLFDWFNTTDEDFGLDAAFMSRTVTRPGTFSNLRVTLTEDPLGQTSSVPTTGTAQIWIATNCETGFSPTPLQVFWPLQTSVGHQYCVADTQNVVAVNEGDRFTLRLDLLGTIGGQNTTRFLGIVVAGLEFNPT
jgi:hypothetical protein